MISVWLLYSGRRYGLAFICVMLQFFCAFFAYGIGQYPYILDPYITIQSGATHESMGVALVIAFIGGLCLLIPSLILVFRLFLFDADYVKAKINRCVVKSHTEVGMKEGRHHEEKTGLISQQMSAQRRPLVLLGACRLRSVPPSWARPCCSQNRWRRYLCSVLRYRRLPSCLLFCWASWLRVRCCRTAMDESVCRWLPGPKRICERPCCGS